MQKLIFAAVLLLISFAAIAADGLYLRANTGIQHAQIPPEARASNVEERKETNRIAVGYRFTGEPFAVELGLVDKFNVDFMSGALRYNLQARDVWDISMLGYIRGGLYAKVAVVSSSGHTQATNGVVTNTTSYSDIRPAFGVGYDYALSKRFDANVEVMHYSDIAGNSNFSPTVFSIGLKYKH